MISFWQDIVSFWCPIDFAESKSGLNWLCTHILPRNRNQVWKNVRLRIMESGEVNYEKSWRSNKWGQSISAHYILFPCAVRTQIVTKQGRADTNWEKKAQMNKTDIWIFDAKNSFAGVSKKQTYLGDKNLFFLTCRDNTCFQAFFVQEYFVTKVRYIFKICVKTAIFSPSRSFSLVWNPMNVF